MYCAFLLFLFSCFFCTAAPSYDVIFTTTREGITLSAHTMTAQECTHYFLHNLHAHHVYPIHLKLTNNTEKTWFISGNSIEEFSLVPPQVLIANILFQHHTTATLTAYGCAITGWLGLLAGFNAIRNYLPNFAITSSYLTAAATLASFIYKAHLFVEHRSQFYLDTQARIMHYGLGATNMTIDPHSSIELAMFLNDKSYARSPMPIDTFYYLFSVKLYDVSDSSTIIALHVELPKLYFIPN